MTEEQFSVVFLPSTENKVIMLHMCKHHFIIVILNASNIGP